MYDAENVEFEFSRLRIHLNRSRETVFVMPFGDEKVTQFSGFPPTSVSYLKRTSEVVSQVKVKKTVTGPAPYETESDSDPDSLSDETKSENVGRGKTVNVTHNPSQNHTLDFGKWRGGRFPIIFKERADQTCQIFSRILKIWQRYLIVKHNV